VVHSFMGNRTIVLVDWTPDHRSDVISFCTIPEPIWALASFECIIGVAIGLERHLRGVQCDSLEAGTDDGKRQRKYTR